MIEPGNKVNIKIGSWIHQFGWVPADQVATGIVTQVTKKGKISVRVDGVRNKVKRDCMTTTGVNKVCSFDPEWIEPKA